MSMAADLAAEDRIESPTPTTKRLCFVTTKHVYVDLPADQADEILGLTDIVDLADEYERLKRVAHGRLQQHSEADLEVSDSREDVAAGWRLDPWVQPLDGTGRESYLWTARNAVGDARHQLALGRYREGECSELDAVNAELGRLEEHLRVMALVVEGRGPDHRPLDSGEPT